MRWSWIIVAVVVIGIIYYGLQRNQDFEKAEKGETVGVIIETHNGRRAAIKASYTVDGVSYTVKTTANRDLVKSIDKRERFTVAYTLEDHWISKVLLNKPYIEGQDNLYVHTFSAYNGRYPPQHWLSDDVVEFTYRADGAIHKKLQLIDNYSLQKEAEGIAFPVIYLRSDPDIAYICMDTKNCWQGPDITIPLDEHRIISNK